MVSPNNGQKTELYTLYKGLIQCLYFQRNWRFFISDSVF